VDADDDGMHIACLIIALLYKFAPEFLKEGRLCWLHAPLFKVTSGKTTKYFYTEEQVNQAKVTGTRSRFKGLGEMKDEDSRVMFGPDQWLEQLSWDDSVAGLIEDLMGDDSQPKKDFVFSRIDFEDMVE
jgi:DNA gyrase subunit B